VKLEHLDEDGEVCTRHAANGDQLLTFATIGTRVVGFNHDLASKLQGVMMALDEITELVEGTGDPELRRAAETARTALDDASTLLSANRALTRTSRKTKGSLRDIVTAACARAGVRAQGNVPEGQVEAVIPLLVQALGLAIDAIAGHDRVVEVSATREGDRVKLVFASSMADPARSVGDALALASLVIANANGELRCGREHRLHVQLPLVG
jgi:signal transduction histidine kinase